MYKLEIAKQAIIRSPRFPFNGKLKDHWEDLKSMISEASPDFYRRIHDLSFCDLESAEQRIQDTVHKYFNRSKFRSTPYGSFAAVSVAPVAYGLATMSLSDSLILHKFPSLKNKDSSSNLKSLQLNDKSLLFFSNTTYYKVEDQLRYIMEEDSTFQLSAIDYDEDIEALLSYCSLKRSFSEIKSYFNYSSNELSTLLQDLINVRLLLTSKYHSIIASAERDYDLTGSDLNQPYIISERQILNGGLNAKVFMHLPELVLRLSKINEVTKAEVLESFIINFQRKYEEREVPLMIALDPEAGIGYGNFANKQDESLIDKFSFNIKSRNLGQDSANSKALPILVEAIKNNNIINLEDLPYQASTTGYLPNSIGVLCTQVDDNIFLESMGGATSNALTGRFAYAVSEIHEPCKRIAKLEMDSNPEIVFFDVGYSFENTVDDINRRPVIYPYQLSILNYDTTLRPISCNDILVSVKNGKVLLRSKSLNKRLVPRFASAYNYTRSDLALFRFLMDVQSQDIITNLKWQPSKIFPGLPFYPRVQFRNIIVSPAMWLLESDIIKGCSQAEAVSQMMDKLSNEIEVSYFKIGNGDQNLLLYSGCRKDISILLSLLKQAKSLYIEEAALPTNPNAYDSFMKPYLPQYNLTLQHTSQIYNPVVADNKLKNNSPERHIPPGGDWLYWEVFGYPHRLETILRHKINEFLKQNQTFIQKWFFIRYNDGGEHIRLRIHLTEPRNGYTILTQFKDLLQNEINLGLVSEIRLNTYKKEISRYSERLMDQVEHHFCKDSSYIMEIARFDLSDLQRCALCLRLLQKIRKLKIFGNQEFFEMVNNTRLSYNREFEITHADFKEVNKLYSQLYKEPLVMFPKDTMLQFNEMVFSLGSLIAIAETSKKQKLFTDLFHMHVNRLFITNQRFMEMLIYNFIQLEMRGEMRQGNNQHAFDIRA